MAFTDDEKVKIRYYAGYPAFGQVPTAATGWRFITRYGDLEYRMNNLSSFEETKVRALLSDCETAESNTRLVSQNMDTTRAAVWYRNKNELAENYTYYYKLRRELTDMIGCQLGPKLSGAGSYRRVV